MSDDFQRAMQEATRFVRSGNLQAATAAIQAALSAGRDGPARERGVTTYALRIMLSVGRGGWMVSSVGGG